MFSSSKSFPSSTHSFPSSSSIFFVQEQDVVYLNNHSFVTGDCSFDHAPVVPPLQFINESGLQSSDNHNPNPDNNHNHNHNQLNNLCESVISHSRKRVATSKKDRHSKIFTAQGPRDRRVRLSIDISKKLFSLQDLLGFDKASKTLDWLFTKSKTAIKELVQEMKHTSSSTLSNRCEQVFMENGDFVDNKGKKKKAVPKCVNINGGKKKKKTTPKQKSGFHVNVATRCQLRAEARARARARGRTTEKLRIKKLENDVKNMLGDHNYCYLQSACGNQVHSQSIHQVNNGDSFVEQKFPKPYSLLYSSQHNYVDSKDSSFQLKSSIH